jgi:hypothetical protein
MDLFKTLRQKVDTLGEGDYLPGLRAILLHIETAHKHLERGQNNSEETAFTDAIYRTNQAFEGSIKEAYRVLAGKDPARQRPFDIEKYLEDEKTFRPRVLAQLTNYRTEWRNPSAHDYKLDFDESEAFLAIVSVSAFACLLLDQIAERLSFDSAKAHADAKKTKLKKGLPSESADLLERSVAILQAFTMQLPNLSVSGSVRPLYSEAQLLGALSGFISSVASDLIIETDVRLLKDASLRGDLVISRGNDKVLVELKREGKSQQYHGIAQLEHYMLVSQFHSGILFLFPSEACELYRDDQLLANGIGKIVVLSPKKEPQKKR